MDHRKKVGLQRRQRMRQRLIESALIVFAEKGIGATVIDDVIATAKVSRGTFYNYFGTTDELLGAAAETLSNELISLIEPEVENLSNPLERLSTGLRLFLHVARQYPDFARFTWRAGFNAATAGHLVYTYLPRHIEDGMRRGVIDVPEQMIALETISGITLAALFAQSSRTTPGNYPEIMVNHTLLALGADPEEAEKLTQKQLPPLKLGEDSLIVRSYGKTAA